MRMEEGQKGREKERESRSTALKRRGLKTDGALLNFRTLGPLGGREALLLLGDIETRKEARGGA